MENTMVLSHAEMVLNIQTHTQLVKDCPAI